MRQDGDVDMMVIPAGHSHSLPPPDLAVGPGVVAPTITQPPSGCSSRAPPSPSSQMQRSVDSLEANSQAVRLALAAKEQSDKSTPETYERHVKRYATWWDTYQTQVVQSDATMTAIPALPITAAKVTMFLEYESTRPKVSRKKAPIRSHTQCRLSLKRKHGSSETIPGSVVGKSVIAQAISALESHRFQHQHLYKIVPDSQVGLRLDARIRRFEAAAKHNEPKRIESAQVLKAAGSSSGGWNPSLLYGLACSLSLMETRYVLQGGAPALLALVPDGLLWTEGRLHWHSRPCNAPPGHDNRFSRRKLQGGRYFGHVPVLPPHR